MTRPNAESSSPASVAQPPSLSASMEPLVKPGEYPFKRGESTSQERQHFPWLILSSLSCFFFSSKAPVLKTPSPSLKRSVSFPQSAGEIPRTWHFSAFYGFLIPDLLFSLHRKITSIQIDHKIWIFTKSGQVRCCLSHWASLASVLRHQKPLFCFYLNHFSRRLNKPEEFKQDGMKSQTLPRSNGAQAKRALFERMNSEPTK